MTDPWAFWTPEQLAAATECPVENVKVHWPKIVEQLDHCGIAERSVQIGMIGTIAIESASQFAPVREAFYLGEPEPAETHRRSLVYYPYFGRGTIQLTHRSNYLYYGPKIAALWGAGGHEPDFDLVNNPDNALDSDISAAVSALYFRDHGGGAIPVACRSENWAEVRRLVYGGADPAGTARITRIAAALGGEPVPVPTPGPLSYDPDARVDQQPDSWSCSIESVAFLLRSIGRNPSRAWLEGQLVPGIVSKSVGLLDGSGAQLAAWITETYGVEMGFVAHAAPVTYDDVLAGAGVNPTMIGGRGWGDGGHWSGLRRADEGGLLELANPVAGYTGVGTHLDRSEWGARGGWSAIYIDRGAVTAPPVPDPIPQPTRAAVLVAEIESRLAELKGLVA